MRVSVLFAIIAALMGACSSIGKSAYYESHINLLTGVWGVDKSNECDTNPRIVSFRIDEKVMVLTYRTDAREVWEYDILEVTPDFLRVSLRDETRMDAKNKPVIWKIVPTSQNIFRWGRDDWEETSFTPDRVRCGT